MSDYLSTLNRCVSKLMADLVQKQYDLNKAETSQGTGHDVRMKNKLRQQIASLKKRLRRAVLLQDAALRNEI